MGIRDYPKKSKAKINTIFTALERTCCFILNDNFL